MTYPLNTTIIIKEYFTEYFGHIIDFKNGVYKVEANGHTHFLTESEVTESINNKNKKKLDSFFRSLK